MAFGLLSLVTTMVVHGAPKSLADCAAFFEDVPASTFEVDQTSARDLEIDDVLFPEIAKHLRTSLGRARLGHLLRNPFLDRKTIVDRQQAVRALADDVMWRREIRDGLLEVERSIGPWFERFAEQLAVDEKEAIAPKMARVWPALWGGTWAAAGGAVATGALEPGGLVLLWALNVIIGLPNGAGQERARQSIYPFRPIFLMARGAAGKLEAQESEVLRRIGDTFAALEDIGRRRDLTTVDRRVRGLVGRKSTISAALGWLTNGSTNRARAAMLDQLDDLRALMAMIGELDVLTGLAEQYDVNREGQKFPKILSEEHPTHLVIEKGHHPWVWTHSPAASVANDVALTRHGEAPRFWLLTGPNTGGKSTYLKMIGVNVVLAQIGAPVPAEEMRLTPLAIFTNKNASERIQAGESSFEAQCRRAASLLERAERERHVLILADEILTGTSPEEHAAIKFAIIEDMVHSRYVGILATHDRKLQKLEGSMDGVRNLHVDDEARAAFAVREGPSTKRNAIEVLRKAGVKTSIVESAQRYLDTNHPEQAK